jgi:transposase
MSNSSSHSLSQNFLVQDGDEVRPLYPYGIGIDTHRDFIQVCVLIKEGEGIRQYETKRSTAWNAMKDAAEWAKTIVRTKSIPTVEPEPLHYTIESTSTYHIPVLKAFGGKPSVVNPVLAGATRRKTDVLDARLLAYQSMTGLWPSSFVVSPEIQEFRLLMRQRAHHIKMCTNVSNRINNYILRFGHTLGSGGSVRHAANRALIEDMCSEDFVYNAAKMLSVENGRFICPEGLPPEVGRLIMEMYDDFDNHSEKAKHFEKAALDYAKGIQWETDAGYVSGEELVKNLKTIPSVGDITALVWLSEVVTPLRFETAKHLSAYCGCDPSLKVSADKVTSHVRRKGNNKLHYQLVKVAGTCINRHSEAFGKWGYQIFKKHTKGGYKKATGAVARRIATAMYYVHKKNEPFSYDKYNFYRINVPMKAVEDMGLSKRLVNLLMANEILDSKKLIEQYSTGKIHDIRGFGKKAIQEVNIWLQNNKNKKGNES